MVFGLELFAAKGNFLAAFGFLVIDSAIWQQLSFLTTVYSRLGVRVLW
jgi:hypothetical protein